MSDPSGSDRALLGSWRITLSRYLGLMVVGLAWTALLARSLGPAGTGRVLVAATLPALIAPLVNLGLPSAVGWLTARQHYDERTAAGAATLLAAVIGAVSCVGVVGAIAVWGVVAGVDTGYLMLGASGLDPFVGLSVVAAVFMGRRRFGAYALTLTAAPTLALLVGGAGELFVDMTAMAFIAAWVGAYYVVGATAIAYLGSQSARPTPQVLRAFARESVSFGWRVWVGESAVSARTRADLYLVAALVGASAAGFYGAAVGVAAQVGMVSQSAYFVVFPTVAQADVAEVDRQRQTAIVARLTFAVSVVAAILVAILGRPLIRVFLGAEFLDSYLPLLYYLPAVVILSVSRILTAAILARGLPGTVMIISLATLALNIVLNLLMIPAFGLPGAALAASLTALANAGWRYIVYRRIVGGSVADLLLVRKGDVALVVGRFGRSAAI